MATYYYQTNSITAPFFSDPSAGFVEATTAMEALKKLVKEYPEKHLYSMVIQTCEPTPKLLARYLSDKAVATAKAGEIGGSILKEGKNIFINHGKENEVVIDWTKEKPKWENFE